MALTLENKIALLLDSIDKYLEDATLMIVKNNDHTGVVRVDFGYPNNTYTQLEMIEGPANLEILYFLKGYSEALSSADNIVEQKSE